MMNYLGEKTSIVQEDWEVATIQDMAQKFRKRKNSQPLRNLAIYFLRKIGGWKLEDIGELFQMNKGQVLRIVQEVQSELENYYETETEMPEV